MTERMDEIGNLIETLQRVIDENKACTLRDYIFAWDHDLAVALDGHGMFVTQPRCATEFPPDAKEVFLNGNRQRAKLVERQAALAKHTASLEGLLKGLRGSLSAARAGQ